MDPASYGENVVFDPLRHGEPLPLAERFFPLGFPVVVRTNSGDVIAAGRESWGEYEPAFDTPPIELRVVVRGDEGEPTRSDPEAPVPRAQGHLLALVLGTDNFAACDLDGSFGSAWITPAVARNHSFTAFHFLDSMAYICIGQRYATPIHASCVARNGDGILLVGGPGAGKSSLAWACAKVGLAFVSDDGTWLLRNSSEPTLIGKHRRMRFRPDALDLFPELSGVPRKETVVGKHSFEIRSADVPGLATASRCRPWRVIFLERQQSGAAHLYPVTKEEAWRRLSAVSALYEARVWEQQDASRKQLVRGGAVALRYSNLADAVEQILKLQ